MKKSPFQEWVEIRKSVEIPLKIKGTKIHEAYEQAVIDIECMSMDEMEIAVDKMNEFLKSGMLTKIGVIILVSRLSEKGE
jgi:hypothetical protein